MPGRLLSVRKITTEKYAHNQSIEVTCAECATMVGNMRAHVAYMDTSAGYIGDQIKRHT